MLARSAGLIRHTRILPRFCHVAAAVGPMPLSATSALGALAVCRGLEAPLLRARPGTVHGGARLLTSFSSSHILAPHSLSFSVLPVQSSSTRGLHGSTAIRAAKGDTELVKALTGELEHEEENYEAPEGLESGPPKPFTVESKEGAAELVLRRSFKGEDISVTVSIAQDEAEEEDDFAEEEVAGAGEGEGEKEEGEEEEVEGEEAVLEARVCVSKKGADGSVVTMEMDCVLDGAEWIIESVKLPSANAPSGSIPYSGPEFYTLDQSVQEQFDAFLVRRGFTQELASFVRASAEVKEQKEYVGWLKRVADFVGAPSK